MKRLPYIIGVLLLATCASSTSVTARVQSSRIDADLDGDGTAERIELDNSRDPSLTVRRGRRLLWQGVHGRWKPWKLAVADVDGDGKREIIVGVYKATRYFPKPHNCLFVYGWNGSRAFPKWLGSTLSKPFTDFAFNDPDKDGESELMAIETLRNGKHCISVYSWNGFGFTLDWQRGVWTHAALLPNDDGTVVIKADGERIILTNKSEE